MDCGSCHSIHQWRIIQRFDHSRTGYELEGAHRAVVCAACHKPREGAAIRAVSFSATVRQCAACHEDPHAGQFASLGRQPGCESCHSPARWQPAQFDHASSFPLTGGHAGLACRQCHSTTGAAGSKPVLRYRGTPRECSACHN